MSDLTKATLDDSPASDDLLDQMVEVYGKAIQAEHGTPDSTFDAPYIKALQRVGMRAVYEAVGSPTIADVRNAGYYRGRDAERKSQRHKHDKHFDALMELVAFWRDRAKSAEGKLRRLRDRGIDEDA
jgi:hypothetical protein